MAPKQVNETYTEFGGGLSSRWGSIFSPTGRLGKWFSKFSAGKAQRYVDSSTSSTPGDALASEDQIRPGGNEGGWGLTRYALHLPEVEVNRKKRYLEFEKMDEYPEVGAAFDIYADDCTQKNLHGDRWKVISEDQLVIDEINKLFQDLKIDRYYWDIVRNTCKYGDNFIETIVDMNNPQKGIRRIKILNPKYVLRVEDKFGYLTAFLQEIPDKHSMDGYNEALTFETKIKYIKLDKNQIIHFRLHTSDPLFYPYGKSIASLGIRIYRSLMMMEDAMLIYRLARAPERRIFYIETGSLPASKAEAFIERVKKKYKKEKFYNTATGSVDARYNPLSADEDYFVPIRKGSGAKIETLPGAQNLGEVDDVKYFRDKLLASLKIPKDYIVEKDKSPERKANLSQLDVKFARTIERIKKHVEVGFETLAKRHLMLKNFPVSTVEDLRIELPDPSDMFTKRKIEVEDAKTRVVTAALATGLFDKATVLKEFYDMTDQEIKDRLKAVEEEQKQQMEQEQQMAQQMPGGGGMPGQEEMGGAPEQAGINPPEPPQQESTLPNLRKYLRKSPKTLLALKRIEERLKP